MAHFETSCTSVYHSASNVEAGVDIVALVDSLELDGIQSDEAQPNNAELVVRYKNQVVLSVPVTYLIQRDAGMWEIPFAEFAPFGLPGSCDSSFRYNVQVVNGAPGTKLYYRHMYALQQYRKVKYPVVQYSIPEFNNADPQIAMLPPGEYTGFLIPRSIPGHLKIKLDIGSIKAFEIDYSQIMLYGKARGDYVYFRFLYTVRYETKLSVNTPVKLYYAAVSIINVP